MRIKPIATLLSLLPSLLFSPGTHALSLFDAVTETITTNPDVLIARSQRNAVEQEMVGARAGFYPQTDITVGYGSETSYNSTTRASGAGSRTLDRSEAEIQIRQLLFDGARTRSEFNRQKSRVNSRAYSTFGKSEVTALRAVEVYLDVLREEKLVRLAMENLDSHQKTYDRIRKRGESGVGRKSDTEQALGRLALAKTNLLAETNNQADATAAFENVVGQRPVGLEEPASMAHLLPADLDEVIKQALGNHPTLKSAEADVEAAHYQEKTAKSAFYPRVHLEVSGTENKDIDGIPGPNRDGQIMVRGRYNLTGGRDMARREETSYLLNEAREIRNRTHRQVVESIQLSWNAYQTAKEQLEYFKAHVDASEAARNAYRKQFNIGQRSLLDVLDSENELFSAQIDYVNGQNELLFAAYRILAGTGKLLWAMQIPVPEEADVIQ
ncbi:MAG: TolC family outer membrane protein [Gammaproteobacteria bacterium]